MSRRASRPRKRQYATPDGRFSRRNAILDDALPSHTASLAAHLLNRDLPLLIWTCDKSLIINRVLHSNLPPEQHSRFIGKNDYDFLRPEDADHLMQIKRGVIDRSTPVHETVSCLVAGETRTYELLITPELDETGQAQGITVISVELTNSLKQPTGGIALHKRSQPVKPLTIDSPGQIRLGDVLIGLDCHSLQSPSRTIRLSQTERRLLKCLTVSLGRVIPREDLLERIWGAAYVAEHGLLHDAVSRLRRRFRDAGLDRDAIQTVHGVGYVLTPS